jgi:hypothetical protein
VPIPSHPIQMSNEPVEAACSHARPPRLQSGGSNSEFIESMLRSVDDPEGGWGQFSLEEVPAVHLGDGCGEAWAQHHHASVSPAARGSAQPSVHSTHDAGGQHTATAGGRAHATCRRQGTWARV